ncbi:ISLre2 family transposase [Enterococcus sp. ZJ1622]|uniref:ISLre2 family transposase n=1 Tax=Enterococcus sp. ZJ1622 TaxID=2709401 RepID=UPI0013ECAF32|nr:ISLre2 family transposase [Enterococcus sp. ZJ1622]
MLAIFMKNLQNIFLSETDFIVKENQLLQLSSTIMNYLFNRYIKMYEPELLLKYQARGYVIGKSSERSVYFLFGELTYTRTPVERNGHIVYPIDELLGIERYTRYSVGTKYALVELSMVTSYRKSSELIETLTNVTASKDTVMKVVHEYGEKYKEHEAYLEEYGTEGTQKVDYLYIEGDGVFVGGKDGKNKELAHFIVHEGIETNGQRKKTENLKQFVGLGHKRTLDYLENYLYRTYDLKNTVIVTNSDGGKGYSQKTFKSLLPVVKRHEHFLDRYHVSVKLEQRVFVPELIPVFQKAINNYSTEDLKCALDTLESHAETEEQEIHVKKLRGYLRRNWKIIKPYHIRELPGEKQGIGIMESLHRILTFRMKRNSKYWGKGLEAMAWLLTTKRNGTMKEIFLEKWKEAFALDDRLVAELGNRPNSFFDDEGEKVDNVKTYAINYQKPSNHTKERLDWYKGK